MKASAKKSLAAALETIEARIMGEAANNPGPIDVARVRKRTGMTQRLFARRFGFPVATLRHWERGAPGPGPLVLGLQPRADAA